jgi:TRAP-type C4-dicarboxylate transport system substrate-binding protein
MKKKGIWVIVSVLVVSFLLLSPKPAPAKAIKLKFHSPFPPAGLNLASRWWMDEVEKRSNGKVKFDRIFGGALGTLDEQPMAIKSGSFDIGQVSVVYNPGLYPRATLTILPFLTDDVSAHGKAAHDLFRSPELEKEFAALNQKYLMPGVWITIEMMSYEPIRTIADMRKAKIRAHGGSADALSVLGITTYAVPWGELPAAAERRVVDASIMGCPTDAYDFGFGDIFSYWERIKFYYFPFSLVINQETWNKLPADVQKVMEDVNAIMPAKAYELYNASEVAAEKKLIDGGLVKIVEFKDLEKLKAQTSKPVWDKWVADRKAQGIDGQALLDKFLGLVKKHQ